MTAQEARTELIKFLDEQSPSAVLVFGVLDESPSFRRIAVAQEIADRIQTAATRWSRGLTDFIATDYRPGQSLMAGELAYYENEPVADALVDEILPVSALPAYAADEEFLRSVSVVITVLTGDDLRAATLFRRVTKKFILQRTAGWKVVFREGVFDTVDDDIVQLEDRFDCLHWDGYLYIRNVSAFEQLFDYKALRQARAEETLEILTARIRVDDPDLLVRILANDGRYYRKLESIRAKKLHERIEVEALEEFVLENDIALQFADDDLGHRILVFDDSQEGRRVFLEVMDDDHLVSELTRDKYRAWEKRAR